MFNTESDPIAAVRQQQENEGRRRISMPGERPNYNKGKPTYKKPFVAKGHDAILNRVQQSGEHIAVVLISGDTLKGTIVARDKFTITMRIEAGREVFENTVYKHAIELISRKVEVAAQEPVSAEV